LLVKCALNDFQTECAPVLNALTIYLKAINSLIMFYNKQGKKKTDLSFSEIAFKI